MKNELGHEKYLSEMRTVLRRNGFEPKPEHDGLEVKYNDYHLCAVNGEGTVFYSYDDVRADHMDDQLDKVIDLAKTVHEYMSEMERAPILKATDLDEKYKLLAEFNGVVFAGRESSQGVQFVTWSRDYSGRGVCHGHYAAHHYLDAKEDFAVRSGLIREDMIFKPKQLVEIYRACTDAREYALEMTSEQVRLLRDIQGQIFRLLPDMDERLESQNNAQEQTLG